MGLWETLTSAVRRIRIRLGDEAWAAAQPGLSKLHAGYSKLTGWRRRRADALSYTAAQLRASWQGATRRRRAAVGVLAVLPFAMASGVTAMVLPGGGDPRAGPAQEREAADAPAKQDALGATTATASSRGERPNPARAAPGGAGSGLAAEGAAVTPDAAASSDAGSLDAGSLDGGSGGGDSPGGHSGAGDGGDSPVHERSGSRGLERRTSAAPAPPARTPSGRAPVDGDGQRSVASPPATKAPAPQSGAPAAPPTAAPPVTETAPEVPEPDADLEEDSDSSGGEGPGNSDRRGPPADRGGGSGDKDEDDEDVDP